MLSPNSRKVSSWLSYAPMAGAMLAGGQPGDLETIDLCGGAVSRRKGSVSAAVWGHRGKIANLMATATKIEWTERTWNPVTGCTKLSPGCKHCYAETMARRLTAMGAPGYERGFEVTVHPDR